MKGKIKYIWWKIKAKFIKFKNTKAIPKGKTKLMYVDFIGKKDDFSWP